MKNISNKILIFGSFALSVALGVYMLAAPKGGFSDRENRVLADFPKFSYGGVISGEFSKQLGNFYEDNFPLRPVFTTISALSERCLGRGESNGVIYCREDYLVIRPEYDSLELFDENLYAVKEFCSDMKSNGIQTAVFFAPRGIDVLEEYLPAGYSQADRLWDRAGEILPDHLEANDQIVKLIESGEYAWYKTDHHWTPIGAYEGYKSIVTNFKIEAMELSTFKRESLSDEFYGSVDSRSGNLLNSSDEFFAMRVENDNEFVLVNHDTGRVYESLYFQENLETKDKYNLFLGGNFGHLSVYSSQGDARETLLLIKDSFANAAVPYLAQNYNLEIYDLRYFKGKISDEIYNISPDKILILYGIDSLATEGSLKLIGR